MDSEISNRTEDKRLIEIRNDFPILSQKINGSELVYFDNAATTQKPNRVIDAITDFYSSHNSNVHRGVHTLSQRSTEFYEDARNKVKVFLNAASSEEIIFTAGTTDSINLAATALEDYVGEGDEILTTEMEHHSNFVPWQVLAKKKKASFKVARLNEKGEVDIAELESLMNEKTKVLAINHASNTLGTINDIKEITRLAKSKNILVVVDGAQWVAHGKTDVQVLNCDLYAFSGHKLFGPTGIGVLYGKKALLEKMSPYRYGGGMISEVNLEQTTYSGSPQVFEAGTPNVAGAHGLGFAIDYIKEIGWDFIEEQESSLLEYATAKMKEIPGIRFFGTSENKVSLNSFLIGDIHPFDLGTMLDQMGIAVRTGHHCTQPIMQCYNIPGTVRASFAFYNTHDEVDRLIEGIHKAIKILS